MPTTPNPPKGLQPELQSWVEEMTNAVRELQNALRPGNNNSMPFSITNPTDSRTIDASAATLAELRNFVGTLTEVLKSTRIIK